MKRKVLMVEASNYWICATCSIKFEDPGNALSHLYYHRTIGDVVANSVIETLKEQKKK